MLDRQRAGDGVLRQIRVLIFVDEDESVALVEAGADFVVFAQQRRNVKQQVVEIGGIRSGQLDLVCRIGRLDDLSQGVARPRLVLLRGDQIVFRPAYGLGDALRREPLGVDLQACQRLPQRLITVVGVVDRVVLLQPDQGGVFSQQPRTKAMKSAHPDGRIAGEPLDPPAHFVGGLVREGQGENVLAGYSLLQQPSDAMRDDARLAAARSGQDQQRSVEVCNRFPLRVGESIQRNHRQAV